MAEKTKEQITIEITQQITANGQGKITGPTLQGILLDINDSTATTAQGALADGALQRNQNLADILDPAVAQNNLVIGYTRTVLALVQIPASILTISTTGYAIAGDGGADTYKRILPPTSPAPWQFTDANGAWWERVITGQPVNIRMFGTIVSANPEAIATNTSVFQQCFDYCRVNKTSWVIPVGDWWITNVTIWTAGVSFGKFYCENSGSLTPAVTIAPMPEDVGNIDVTVMNTWTGVVQGNDKSTDFSQYYGSTVWWYTTDEQLIIRYGNSGLNFQDTIVVADPDGSFYPPIMATKTIPWVTAQGGFIRNRETIAVQGLCVYYISGNGESACAVKITRPNTELTNCSVVNMTATPIMQAFNPALASGVTFVSCYVEGIKENSTNYAFNVDSCVATSITDCTEIYCRRGVDNDGAKMTQVVGGSFPDGIGAHWVYGLYVSGGTYIASDAPNSAPIFVSGADVHVTGCNIRLRADQNAVAAVRSDLFELRGAFEISNNNITLDCTDMLNTVRYIVLLNANTGNHDWGRLVYMPSLISVHNNNISQLGVAWTQKVDIVCVFNSAPTPPNGVSAGGLISVSGNSFDFAAGYTLTNGNPRIGVTTLKYPFWIAGGYQIDINNCPTLQAYLFCSNTVPDLTVSRQNFYCREIGTLLWQGSFGAFKVGQFNTLSMNAIGANRPSSGANTTPVGDEQETRTDILYGFFAWTPGTVADNAKVTTTVTMPGIQAGDCGVASHSAMLTGDWILYAVGNSANTTRVTALNKSGAPATIGNGTLRVKMFQN